MVPFVFMGFVLLGGSSEFLGVMELNYLERFFYDEALRARRYKVLNKAKPSLTLVDPATKMILNNYTVLALFLLQHQFNCRVFVGPEGFFPGQKLYLNNAAKDVQATGKVDFVFVEDHEFPNTSSAASVI